MYIHYKLGILRLKFLTTMLKSHDRVWIFLAPFCIIQSLKVFYYAKPQNA